MSTTRKFLVTGGAGFVGSHLCEFLVGRGDEVVCFDNLSTGMVENIEHINGGLTFIEGDVNSREELKSVFKNHKFDGIFHYAAMVGVKRTLEDPLAVLADIEGTKNILKLALEHGKPKVVFASSSEVYGEPLQVPEVEDGLLNPHLPYAVVKLYNEKMVEAYWQVHKLPSCSLRFFNVYGPRQESSDYGFVVGIFIKRVLEGKSPIIFGDGLQTRDFVYVNDNIRAAVLAFESEKANGEAINIGVGRPTTVLDLAERVVKACGMEGKIEPEFVPPRGDIRHRSPDTQKMQKLLNFHPETSLDKGLEKTIDWYKES